MTLALLARCSAAMPKLVFYLHSDDCAAVLEKVPVGMAVYLGVEAADLGKVAFVVCPQRYSAARKPVGKAAVSDLCVAPRSDTEQHIQSALLAAFKKEAEVTVAIKGILALYLLVMNPDDIGGNDCDAARFHFI